MKKFLSVGLACLFLLLLPSSVLAQAIPSNMQYYDWSSTKETSFKESVLGFQARAQTDATAAAINVEASVPAINLFAFNKYLFGKGLTPETPFYLFKRIQENVVLLTTFNRLEKEKLKLSIAAERLSEAEKLSQKASTFGIGFISDDYRKMMVDLSTNLEKLQKQGVNVSDLLKLMDLETAKHTIMWEKVLVLTPKPAKEALERARRAAFEGGDTVADLTGRPAVPPDMASRIAALKAQGLLTEEEANKLVGVKTRSEAREEFRKYVNGGIIPESDFLRLSENLKTYYPREFYQIHELKRFSALKTWEEQKPSEDILSKIAEFANNYKTGEIVPAELRKYWGPIVQLEELQSTIRLDLVDAALFKNNPDDERKFKEIIERYKPRPEDVAFLNNYLVKNPQMKENLPPEYERMKNLAEKFGAQCGPRMKWVEKVIGSWETGVVTGMCVPEESADLEKPISVETKNCREIITSAKSADGVCIVFPNSCIPAGWRVVESCTETPSKEISGIKPVSCPSNSHFVPVYGLGSGYCVPNYTPLGNGIQGSRETSCPSGYHRNYQGGSCLPDFSEKFAREGYLPPLTINPGGYPAPFYPPAQRCPGGQHWIPEPINPQGGYCQPDNYQPPGGSSAGSCPQGRYQGPGGICTPIEKSQEAWRCSQAGKFWDGQECRDSAPVSGSVSCPSGQTYDQRSGACTPAGYGGIPNPQMGNCRTPGECYDWCKANPGSDKCPGFNPNSPRPGDIYSPSRESQEAACRAGGGVCVSWVNGACGCERNTNTGCRPPDRGCEAGKWWDQRSCTCRNNDSYPSACTYPSGGCQSGYFWDAGTCTCRPPCSPGTSWNGSYCMSNTEPTRYGGPSAGCSNYTTGMCGSGWFDWGTCSCKTSDSGSNTGTPPSGYGACSSGQYWNGSSCVSSSPTATPTTESMEEACRRGGCTWTGSGCNCPTQTPQTPVPSTPAPSTPTPQENTPPPSTPAPETPPPATPSP